MELETKINPRYIFLDGPSYGDVMGAVSEEPNYRPVSTLEAINLMD